MSDRGKFVILANDSGRYFAQRIADYIYVELGGSEDKPFGNTEGKSVIKENVRGCDVYAVQCVLDHDSGRSVNDNVQYSRSLIEAARRSGANHVTTVLPLYPYARQDSRFKFKTGEEKYQREAITASTIAKDYETSGIDGFMTISAHCRQAIGFFDPRTIYEDLSFRPTLVKHIKKNHEDILNNLIIASPDSGGASRCESYAERFGGFKMVVGLKDRDHSKENKVEKIEIIGNIEGKNILVVDDMIDSAGTIDKFAREAKKNGAEKIYVAATHGIFSDPCYVNLTSLYNDEIITNVIVSDSVKIENRFLDLPFIEQISVACLFGDAISAMNKNKSISELSR